MYSVTYQSLQEKVLENFEETPCIMQILKNKSIVYWKESIENKIIKHNIKHF